MVNAGVNHSMNQIILRAGFDKSRIADKSKSGVFDFSGNGNYNRSESSSRSTSRGRKMVYHNNRSYSTSNSGNWVRSWSKSLSSNRAFSKSGNTGAFPVKVL